MTKDVAFVNYVDSIVNILSQTPADTTIRSYIHPGMIQVIYVKSEYLYYTINMDRSFTGDQITNPSFEINGKMVTSNKCQSFQEIIDQIVSYKDRNNIKPSDELIRKILYGYREPLFNAVMGY